MDAKITHFLNSYYVRVTFDHLVDDELVLNLVEDLLICRLDVLHSVQLITLKVAIR